MKWLPYLLVPFFAFGAASSLQSLYTSLDPTSVSQHFAFYELYPDTPLGKQALRHAWTLLQGGQSGEQILPSIDIRPIVAFVNRNSDDAPALKMNELKVIEKLGHALHNRKLKGFGIWDKAQLQQLAPEEIDLARGLFLAELDEDTPEARQKILSYEAHLDLMALQVLARLSDHPTPQEMIRTINDYIFGELRFRFPPHSLSVSNIDAYTVLPSVLDSRRGVCLGVSILYLCLAQRLNLNLEAITPPGHIYVRYAGSDELVNIETTARGINTPSEIYLGIETLKLQKRTIREVIGCAFMNQASVCWHKKDYNAAIKLYEKAIIYMPNDHLINMFLGINYILVGRTAEGKTLMQKIKGFIPDHQVCADTLSEDFLAGRMDAAAIEAVFSEVDEKRSSILEKQKKLHTVVDQFPFFRQGLLHLAITYLQLGREKEALPILERYITINPKDPTVNYYLAAIQFQRLNYKNAWHYLKQSEAIVFAKDHHPKALKDLREELQRACPEGCLK